MTNLLEKIQKMRNCVFIILGVIVTFLGYLPNIILQKGSVFAFQDQLDGEIFTYIFAAKHWGEGLETYSEMFNGIRINGLQMPAPIFVLLYKIFTPFAALLIMHIIIAIFAFLGMYLLIEKCFHYKMVACVVGIVFAYLPFYGVYGLSIMGIPFLIYGVLLIYEKRKDYLGYFIILFFTISSSLVLVGFAILLNMGIIWLVLLIKKNYKKSLSILYGMVEMSLIYIIFNFSLVKQVFGFAQNNFMSNKEAIYVYDVPFWESFKEIFWTGSQHMRSYQKPIVVFSIATILFIFLKKNYNTYKLKKYGRMITGLFLYNLIISILCALYAIKPVVDWRNQVGGIIKYFQLNRISWITPFVWYFIFAILLLYWFEYLTYIKIKKRGKMIVCVFSLLILLGVSGNLLYHSTFKVNVRQMVNPATSNSITWEKYYNEELFTEINNYIGKSQEEYRVICLGLCPAMPLYSEFYCLDGYSNNYDLEYKKKFRKIMENELDKNEALRMYYDNWGNRCYLLSDELGQDFFYRKGNSKIIENLELNTDVIYEMGGRYLFSAVEIKNYVENKLEFLEYFETEKSTIGIYLYEVLK